MQPQTGVPLSDWLIWIEVSSMYDKTLQKKKEEI